MHDSPPRRHRHLQFAAAIGVLFVLAIHQYKNDTRYIQWKSLSLVLRATTAHNATNNQSMMCVLSNLPSHYPPSLLRNQSPIDTVHDHDTEKDPTIYFVVTSSLKLSAQLSKDHQHNQTWEQHIQATRQRQYTRGIQRLINETSKLINKSYKIVIVENNGPRRTFLDDFGVPVLYTNHNNNNSIAPNNKGIKELYDVMACISHFGMRDSDLLVKMTGRYYLEESSCFIQTLQALDLRQTRGIVKFGDMLHPKAERMEDCITGLIMLPVSAINTMWQRVNRTGDDPVEWDWAKAALSIQPQEEAVLAVQGKLGINMAPGGGDEYFLV